MADVGQGEDRLAAVAFAAGHGGDGAGGGDGGLGGVADAVLAGCRATMLSQSTAGRPQSCWYGDERSGRLPGQVLGVVDAALDGREGAALAGQLDAGAAWRGSARIPSPGRQIPALPAEP